MKRYIESPRPVRVWYNASDIGADGGVAFTSALAESAGFGMGMVDYPFHVSPSGLGSRLTTPVIRNIESAIVVVDPKQVHPNDRLGPSAAACVVQHAAKQHDAAVNDAIRGV